MKIISEMRKENIKKNFIVENFIKSNGLYCLVARPKVGELKLPILPSVFGKLLNQNLDNLEKEGLHIESKRTGPDRLYYAKYEEPDFEDLK